MAPTVRVLEQPTGTKIPVPFPYQSPQCTSLDLQINAAVGVLLRAMHGGNRSPNTRGLVHFHSLLE
jgi:hypothetical protein